MGMEHAGAFGPEAVRRVPNEQPSLDAEGYKKLPLSERLGFTQEESDAYTEIISARSLGELRAAIDAFNGVSTPKTAESLGISLDNLEIADEPVSVGDIHDLPPDAMVVASSSMQEGITRFRIVDKKPLSS